MAACTPSTPAVSTDAGTPAPAQGQPVASEGPAADDAAPSPESPPAAEASAPVLAIGWATIPAPPDRKATRANNKALVKHRKGDYEASLAGFDRALALDATHPKARFNRACALSRLSRPEDAAPVIRALLLEDFPTWHKRFVSDEDLQALRDAESGKALTVSLPEIAAAYTQSLERGRPAFSYLPRDGWPEEGEPRVPYTNLRAGVWDTTLQRFVPMVPTVPQALSALLDTKSGRALVIAGEWERKDMWTTQPHGTRASIYSLTDWGERLRYAPNVSDPDELLHSVRVFLAPVNAIYYAREQAHYAELTEYYRTDDKGTKKIGEVGEFSDDRPPAELDDRWPSISYGGSPVITGVPRPRGSKVSGVPPGVYFELPAYPHDSGV